MPPRTFIATTGSGVARAACDADGAWVVQHGLAGVDVRCLAADPLHPGTVYAGTDGQGVLRSDDSGQTWRPAGLPDQRIRAIAASPTQPGVVYAGVKPPALFVSHDRGETWQELEAFRRMRQPWWFTPAEPGPEYVQAIALSPADPDVILAGVEVGAVLRSEDGGQSWSRHCRGALRDCHMMAFHATDDRWVYEGGGGGAALSRDGGRTWSKPRHGLDRFYGWAVGADPARPEVWYASLSPGPFKAHGDGDARAYIFRSVGGAPWEKLGGGLPQPLDHMPYALLTDPDRPGHVYAGLSSGEVWHSADHGESWVRLPFSLGGIHRALILVQHPRAR